MLAVTFPPETLANAGVWAPKATHVDVQVYGHPEPIPLTKEALRTMPSGPWCDGVRNYVIDNVLIGFRDFHIDGLRLDTVHTIEDFSPKHILQEIREEVDTLMKKAGRRYCLLVESDLKAPGSSIR